MRFHEIILEYSREVTTKSLGPKVEAILKDKKSDLSPDALIAQIEERDPTEHKEYTPWLVKMWVNSKGELKLEDIDRHGLLAFYAHAKKRKGFLPPEVKDINKFKTYGDFEDAIFPVYEREAGKEKNDPERGDYKVIYDGVDARIIQPEDKTAACYYGQGTRWCTAGKNSNMFDHYRDDGPMYIIIPKKPEHAGEKYQVHFPTDQWMNERDRGVDPDTLLKRFPQLFTIKMRYSNVYTDDLINRLNAGKDVGGINQDYINDGKLPEVKEAYTKNKIKKFYSAEEDENDLFSFRRGDTIDGDYVDTAYRQKLKQAYTYHLLQILADPNKTIPSIQADYIDHTKLKQLKRAYTLKFLPAFERHPLGNGDYANMELLDPSMVPRIKQIYTKAVIDNLKDSNYYYGSDTNKELIDPEELKDGIVKYVFDNAYNPETRVILYKNPEVLRGNPELQDIYANGTIRYICDNVEDADYGYNGEDLLWLFTDDTINKFTSGAYKFTNRQMTELKQRFTQAVIDAVHENKIHDDETVETLTKLSIFDQSRKNELKDIDSTDHPNNDDDLDSLDNEYKHGLNVDKEKTKTARDIKNHTLLKKNPRPRWQGKRIYRSDRNKTANLPTDVGDTPVYINPYNDRYYLSPEERYDKNLRDYEKLIADNQDQYNALIAQNSWPYRPPNLENPHLGYPYKIGSYHTGEWPTVVGALHESVVNKYLDMLVTWASKQ